MEFFEFLTAVKNDSDHVLKKPVICFTGNAYPISLFSLFDRILHEATVLDMSAMPSVYQPQLETLFLGQRCTYVVRSSDEISSNVQSAWIAYLSSYRGPHTVWCYFSEMSAKKPATWQVVTIPAHIDRRLFAFILAWMGVPASSMALVEQLYQYERLLSLDSALLLARYALVLGSKSEEFIKEWVPQLVMSEGSLFSLSQSFFAKQNKQFFRQWSQAVDYYVPQFWITFWSEQLWRAAMYIQLSVIGDYEGARRVGYRLPFSYLKRDWKNYRISDLSRAHNQLYKIDYRLKHGAHIAELDFFFEDFFSNQKTT